MDIGVTSMMLSSANITNQMSLALMKTSLNQVNQNGNSMIDLLQTTSIHPTLGKNIDFKA